MHKDGAVKDWKLIPSGVPMKGESPIARDEAEKKATDPDIEYFYNEKTLTLWRVRKADIKNAQAEIPRNSPCDPGGESDAGGSAASQ